MWGVSLLLYTCTEARFIIEILINARFGLNIAFSLHWRTPIRCKTVQVVNWLLYMGWRWESLNRDEYQVTRPWPWSDQSIIGVSFQLYSRQRRTDLLTVTFLGLRESFICASLLVDWNDVSRLHVYIAKLSNTELRVFRSVPAVWACLIAVRSIFLQRLGDAFSYPSGHGSYSWTSVCIHSRMEWAFMTFSFRNRKRQLHVTDLS